MTTKSPEELATDHANWRCPEQGPEFIVWCMCRDDFLAGMEAERQRKLDEPELLKIRRDSFIDGMNMANLKEVIFPKEKSSDK